jgi:hypothetical protein
MELGDRKTGKQSPYGTVGSGTKGLGLHLRKGLRSFHSATTATLARSHL